MADFGRKEWNRAPLPVVQTVEPAGTFERGTLYLANVLHPGGCKAAPAALGNLLRLMADRFKVRISAEPREVPLTDPTLFQYHLLFMHGRRSFHLTAAERQQLRTHLQRGGTLFANAICSSKEFGDSFRQEMKTIFPGQSLEQIPASHPLFTSAFGGEEITAVSLRQPQISSGRAPIKTTIRKGEPHLEGLRLDDRYAVIFSPYDISCALQEHEPLECEGYTRLDATKIAVNVLFYSLR